MKHFHIHEKESTINTNYKVSTNGQRSSGTNYCTTVIKASPSQIQRERLILLVCT
jgi:hypothetical protein